MKLIIDIPEDAYNNRTLVNYFGCYSEKLDEVIYDAPTIEMAEDCISREQALRHRHIIHDDDGIGYSVVRVDEIIDLPSVTPQPKRGKWNRVIDKAGHWVWECDKCGWQQRFNTNYCPDCGADMREVQDE